MTEQTRKVLHSSAKDDWGTPQWLFDALHQQYNFTVDLCANSDNAKLPKYCEDIHGGMIIDKSWSDSIPLNWSQEIFFCNPPYGRKISGILDAIPETASGVFLLPSRTGTAWWHNLAKKSHWCFFIKGRLKFKGDSKGDCAAPFDSILMGMNVFQPKGINGIYMILNEGK